MSEEAIDKYRRDNMVKLTNIRNLTASYPCSTILPEIDKIALRYFNETNVLLDKIEELENKLLEQ